MASKPGVQSTLVLSKIDGSIIRSSGLLANATPSNSALGNGSVSVARTQLGEISGTYDININERTNAKHAEDVARMVFSFVSGAGSFVEGMDEGDDLKLLRVRTRKNEIVIVPGRCSLLLPHAFQDIH